MSEKQLSEASKLMKEGAKEAKGGWFSKPDFGSSGAAYFKAGEIYQKAKKADLAKEAYEMAAESYDKCNLSLKCGASYVAAAQQSFIIEQFDDIPRLLNEGKIRYLEGGQSLTAIRAMRDMAQKMKPINKEIAYEIYDGALSLVEDDNQYHWEKDSFLDFATLAGEMNKVPEVYKAWERARKAFEVLDNKDGVCHCIVSSIVLHLKDHDIVAAQRELDEALQNDYFIRSDDYSMIDMLFRGVKNNDGDLIEIAQKSFILQFLKPEIARVIYAFKGPKSVPPEDDKQNASVSAPAAADSVSKDDGENVADEEEDSYGGLL